MNNIITIVKRRPLIAFFILAYGLSWGSYYILSGPFLFPFGAFFAALVMAGLTRGKKGLRELLGRCVRWRVGLIWYAAVFLVPTLIALTTLFLYTVLYAPLPQTAQFSAWYNIFLMFPVALIDAPLWEETAWRGYALPEFPADRSRLFNTLILGLLLAGWHLPIALGGGPLAAPYLVACVASAFVTNWIYYKAGESALFAILYHTTANTMGLYFFSMFSGPELERLYWLLAGVNCLAAALLIAGFYLRDRSDKPLVPAAAGLDNPDLTASIKWDRE